MKPAATNRMQAGIDATARTQPFAQQGAAIGSEIGDLQKKISGMEERASAELKGLDKPAPVQEFHPIAPKDASTFFAVMMALGALSGRSTMAPMTAAMNNMTAIMKGQKEGNDAMVASQAAQFDKNFKIATQKNKEYADEKKAILEKYHYDMAAAKDEMNFLSLKFGIAKGVAGADATNWKTAMQAQQNAERLRISMFGGAKAGWKPTNRFDEDGHEIYYNSMTMKEMPGNLIGIGGKERMATEKNVTQLEADMAKALGKPGISSKDVERIKASYAPLITAAKAKASGDEEETSDPLGIMK
jgi:hypothetical protein